MKHKLLHEDGERTFALVLDTGDEALSGIEEFAGREGLSGSRLTAIGAFERVTLGFFDVVSKRYQEIPVTEQVEVLSLIGDITESEGKPKAHLHVVVGCADGSARGGHLMEGVVRPTLEVLLTESPKHLHREIDRETGLPLIKL